jgi:hypothetical protein
MCLSPVETIKCYVAFAIDSFSMYTIETSLVLFRHIFSRDKNLKFSSSTRAHNCFGAKNRLNFGVTKGNSPKPTKRWLSDQ